MTTILRARVAHTPRDPFQTTGALETFDDGAIAFDETGTIEAVGAFADVRARAPRGDDRGPPRLHRAAGLRRHPRALPADPRDRRDGPAAARLARPAHAAGGGADGRPRLRAADRRALRPAAGRQRDDHRAGVRRPLPAGPERALRGRGRDAACGSPAGSWSPTATSSPTSRSRPRPPTRPARRSGTAGTATAACATRSRRASASRARTRCSTPASALLERRRPVHQPRQRVARRDRLRPPPVPGGARLPRHLRARRPADRPLGARPQRPRLRRRAQTPGDQPHRRSPTARPATPSWPPGSSRWRATSPPACASGWAPTSARAPA